VGQLSRAVGLCPPIFLSFFPTTPRANPHDRPLAQLGSDDPQFFRYSFRVPDSRESNFFDQTLADAAAALAAFRADAVSIRAVEEAAGLLAQRFAAGNKVMICGNGGSSCDANHFAEEFTGRFRADRPPLPAIACTDVGHITCTANDYGYDHVFERWVRALGKPGDVLILLSTSGNSSNIVLAASAGTELGMHTIALLGKDGGRLRAKMPRAEHTQTSDVRIVVPGMTSDRVQELHMIILHALVEGVERLMFPCNYAAKPDVNR